MARSLRDIEKERLQYYIKETRKIRSYSWESDDSVIEKIWFEIYSRCWVLYFQTEYFLDRVIDMFMGYRF